MTAVTEASRLVLGLQPVRELLRVHGHAVSRVAVDDRPLPRLDALARYASDRGVSRVDRVAARSLDSLAHGQSHQGVAAWGPPLVFAELEAVLSSANLAALAIDEIQDPQNFGALVRSAVGLLNAPVLWGEHRSAPLSTAMFRASAGAVEHATLCRVPSLRSALQAAAQRGVQVVGLDAHAEVSLSQMNLLGPTILVVGSEHTGMGRGVKHCCTAIARLAGASRIDSLNASVAAAIALYECWRQRSISAT